jgi:hypothetical protein
MSHQCKPALFGCRVALVAAAITTPVFLAVASPPRLATLFADRSALISTRFGSLSLSFAANGLVRGDSPAILALGEKSSKDSGRWWVRGSSVCIRWETWFEARPRCFAIDLQDGSAFHWRGEDGERGAGQLLDQGVNP